MPSTVNPSSWKTLDLAVASQQRVFINQLVQYLGDMFGGVNNTLNTLNNSVAGFTTALADRTQALGALSTSPQTYNAQSSRIVAIQFTFSVALTLNISNLPQASVILIAASNSTASAHVLKFAATTPAATAYATISVSEYNLTNNMLTTGLSFAANGGYTFIGVSMAGPALYMVAQ